MDCPYDRCPEPEPARSESRSCGDWSSPGDWSTWSTCSGNTQTRTRPVDCPYDHCLGSAAARSESQSCGDWSSPGDWSTWSTCSGNTQTRTRPVDCPYDHCLGPEAARSESQSCGDWLIGSWGSWSTCDGSHQTRSRYVDCDYDSCGTRPADHQSQNCEDFADGDGTDGDPYQITNYRQLNTMRDDLTAHYVLMNDIDASESCGGDCDHPRGKGWIPTSLAGHFDGGDFSISNLYVNASENNPRYSGLFSLTSDTALIFDVSLINVNINLSSGPSSSNGGLVGENAGVIRNSHVSGTIRASSSNSSSSTGALVGLNKGTIRDSYANASVLSYSSPRSSSYSGGLVGENTADGSIWTSYALGSVSCISGELCNKSVFGGLVGKNNGMISNSYSTASVAAVTSTITTVFPTAAAEAYGGGLVAKNGGTIKNSYSTGSVVSSSTGLAAEAYGGGLVAENGGTIENSYSTSPVESSSEDEAYGGGLAAENKGTINKTYALGSLTVSSTDSSYSRSYGGGLVGITYSGSTISVSYAANSIAVSSSGAFTSGGLAALNAGTINGSNYFVSSEGTDGLGSGSCAGTCTQPTGADDAARRAWLSDSLDETLNGDLNWDSSLDSDGHPVWGNLNAAGFPCLKKMPNNAPSC